jgi:Flp pilus assembly protein TadD
MSILIKALKQAERDHLARAAAPAMSSTAVAEAEPPPVMVAVPAVLPPARGPSALSLEPVDDPDGQANDASDAHPYTHADASPEAHADTGVDTAEGLAGAQSLRETPDSARAAENTPAQSGLAPAVEPPAPGAPPPPTRAAPRVVAAVLPTTQDASAAMRARPDTVATAAIPPLDDPAPPAARAGRPPSRPGIAPARPRAGAMPAAPVESGADHDALQDEQRNAARQLMAPAPRSGRLRRLALPAAIAVLIGGGLAAAAWLGLFTGFDGMSSATMPPATAQRTLADRPLPAPGLAGTAPAAHGAAPAPARAARAENRAEAGVAPVKGTPATTDSAPADASATASATAPTRAPTSAPTSAPANPGKHGSEDAARVADGIHLRPPEATPERLRGLLQEAYAAAGRGDTAGATRIYQQVIDLDHNNGDAWIGLAALAANGGDGAAANRDYRRALEIDPGDSVALGGLLGLQTGVDAQEAETRLRLLIVRDGAQPALQAALGKMLARQGRWLEAQETFYQAWAADPTQPDVAFNLAVTLERIRQPLPALSFYRRALELAQTHSARFNPAVAQERVAALTPKQP